MLSLPAEADRRTVAEGDGTNYMALLDTLVEGLGRILMIRGGGTEVVTIFN